MIDMRDEEEDVDSLSPHSQTRHERLHNQYNKLKEEEDQWQDVSHVQTNATCNSMKEKNRMQMYLFTYAALSAYGKIPYIVSLSRI